MRILHTAMLIAASITSALTPLGCGDGLIDQDGLMAQEGVLTKQGTVGAQGGSLAISGAVFSMPAGGVSEPTDVRIRKFQRSPVSDVAPEGSVYQVAVAFASDDTLDPSDTVVPAFRVVFEEPLQRPDQTSLAAYFRLSNNRVAWSLLRDAAGAVGPSVGRLQPDATVAGSSEDQGEDPSEDQGEETVAEGPVAASGETEVLTGFLYGSLDDLAERIAAEGLLIAPVLRCDETDSDSLPCPRGRCFQEVCQ